MSTGECIHGLEVPLCDICYPRATPEPAPAPRATRSTPTRSPRPAGRAAPSLDLGAHRVHHVTHLENLLSILADGALRADAVPAVDESSAAARELRATTSLPGGGSAADRVAFYLSPDALRWRELRDGAQGPMWSDAARAARPADHVVLVAPLGGLDEVVLADGDAAATMTRFASVEEDRRAATSMLARLVADPDALARGEALGPVEVPFSAIALVVVANAPVRARVRGLLDDAGAGIRIAVNPATFVRE